MKWLNTIVEELLGLFLDDRWLALAIILWPVVLWLAIAFAGLPGTIAGPVLFIGLLCILAESAIRRARK